ncbi:Ca2+-binding protein [Commensalibacter communis]|uniref:RTX toxin-related n=6 Tax=Commensalibacter communis TaxID=2972786 RepID=A0A9W4TQF5_9PROT|nr:hypothetical protein [Commensalibacter communis]CAI3955338.1 Ca2+-binding protein [Commensalibacter communis]CAI3957505.1 Ca2+-binding protein [Commensalibacter communis]CAI3958325.1 Ca2+-binding protein [Commensalibacter communis]
MSSNIEIIGTPENDYLSGGDGSNTYVLSKGAGHDTIYNHVTNPEDKDIIQFTDVSSKDVTGASIEGNDLIIQYGENDSVRLQYYFDPSNSFRVQEYQFTDQTLNNDQLMALLPIDVKTDNNTYQFGNGGNQINGNAFNNSYYSGNGNDVVQTGDGNNYVDAQDGDDQIIGGIGNDTIYGGAGNDVINGGAGNDSLYGGAGNDTIYGGSGNDILDGGLGNDSLYGGVGNNILIGGTGDDYMAGDEGSNTYVLSKGDGHDTIYNHVTNPADKSVVQFTDISSKDVTGASIEGNDLIIQYGENDSVRLQYYFDPSNSFRVQEYQFTDQTLNNDQLMALLPIDVKSSDTSYQFGNGGNQINGDASNNNFYSGNGNDIVQTGDGNNYVDAQDGDDQITGGIGNDTIYGGAGNDVINGGAGNDSLYGGSGNDTLIGGAGNDYLSGDEGSDTYVLSKGDGNDTIYNHITNSTDKDVVQFKDISSKDVTGASIEGNDLIIQYGENDSVRLQYYFDPSNSFRVQEYQFTDQTLNNDQLMALLPINVKTGHAAYQFGNGGNQINGDASNNSFYSGNGNDIVQTGDGNNYVDAQDGDDHVYGGSGNDTIYGGTGNDVIDGGAGNDILDGGVGNDTILGGTGNDTIYGGAGDDLLYGGANNDNLYGGAGNDTLIGGTGDDYLSGGEGSNTYVFSTDSGNDTIYNRVVNPEDKSVVHFTDISSKDVSNAYAQGNDLVIQYGKNDSIRLQNYFDQSYNFRVQEYQFTDQTLNNDQLMALLPIDVKTGDTSYQFGNGGNQINGDASNNNFFTGNGNDIIQAGDGNNYVDAQDGDDQIYSGSGNDSLYGGAGNDIIDGGAGNDSLYGGTGNDTLIGGAGDDYLSGDEGSDTYVLSKGAGNDTIYNHVTNSTDKSVIQFTDISSKDVTGASIEGNDLIIQYGENDSVRLQYYFDPSNNFRVQEYQFSDQTLNNDQLMALLPIDVKSSDTSYQFGNGGNQINGDASNNSFFTGNGNDVIQTGDGNNYVNAQDGDDQITGGIGNDTIYGGAGNDVINGGAGNDTLYGGTGNDTLIGGAGDDYLSGDEGSDTYVLSKGDGHDTIYNHVTNPADKSVVQFTDISSKDVTRASVEGNDLVVQYGENDSVRLQYYFDPSNSFRVQEYQFTDQTLNNDQLMALLPIDVKSSDTSYQFGNGGNQINGDASNNNFYSGNGNDIVQTGDGNNYVDAQDGDDQITGGIGNDTIYGGAGNDVINGGAGNDSLYGGAGNDTLIGGTGDDYMAGDEGSNTYVLSKGDGHDTIYNHVTNPADKSVIQFKDISSNDVSGTSIEGNDLVIQYGENDSVRLQYYFDPSNSFRVQEYQFADQTLNNDQLMALLPIDNKVDNFNINDWVGKNDNSTKQAFDMGAQKISQKNIDQHAPTVTESQAIPLTSIDTSLTHSSDIVLQNKA